MGAGRPLRRSVTGCLGLLVLGVALLFVGGGLQYGVDSVFNPWAHSLTGKPVLPGTWVGRVTSPGGQVLELYLDLRRSTNGRGRYSTCRTCPRIEGSAKMCGAGAGVGEYEVWGGPDSWDGSQFHLKSAPAKGGPPPVGLRLGAMSGEWSGDAMNLSMQFGYSGGRADVDEGGNPDVNVASQFKMARGSESDFLAACERLGAQAGPAGK